PATVDGAEHATLRVRPIRMTKRRHQYDVGIVRIDEDLGDLLRVGEADGAPALASIGGAEHADALRNVRAHVRFAGADVDDVRLRPRDSDRADRADVDTIEDRLPRAAGIVGAP